MCVLEGSGSEIIGQVKVRKSSSKLFCFIYVLLNLENVYYLI